MGKALSKNAIIEAIAAQTGSTKQDVARCLAALTELAYREAANGFTLPGLCKFKVVQRRQSRRFNPATRTHYLIAAHDSLKVVPLKKARDTITPAPENLVIRELPAPEKAAPPPPPASTPPPDPAAADQPVAGHDGSVVFACPHCSNTIMAHAGDRGKTADCPACNEQILIPDDAVASAPSPRAPAPDSRSVSDFVTFICEACSQEIEAPLEMIGMDADCPACGSALRVPDHDQKNESSNASQPDAAGRDIDRSSMTIRMDLSDLVN